MNVHFLFPNIVFNSYFLVLIWRTAILANQMEKLQDLSQSELQELLDNPERVESMALESDEVKMTLHFPVGFHFWKAAYCCFQRGQAVRWMQDVCFSVSLLVDSNDMMTIMQMRNMVSLKFKAPKMTVEKVSNQNFSL